MGLLCHPAAGQGKADRGHAPAGRPGVPGAVRDGGGGQPPALCRPGELQLPAVDLPPQRRRGSLHPRADGVAPAGEGSHRCLPEHSEGGSGTEPLRLQGRPGAVLSGVWGQV